MLRWLPQDERTPLHSAAWNNSVNCIKYLLTREDVKVDCVNKVRINSPG